jgi:hypothetical protein
MNILAPGIRTPQIEEKQTNNKNKIELLSKTAETILVKSR